MFRSFFLGGFECATGYNRSRQWIDQIAATQHDRHLDEDYARVRRAGIESVREGIRWPLVDRAGRYDFTEIGNMLRASRKHKLELLFDLFHYGYPPGVDIFGENFADRFAEYCYHVARYIERNSEGPFYFTTVNEPSYFAWAAGEQGIFAPHAIGRGDELKYSLVRAAIQGTNAIWSIIPDAQIISIDPVCSVVSSDPGLSAAAEHFNQNAVFQSLDMIAGRLAPELGGSPKHLGILGINYYSNNQWELDTCVTLAENDARRIALRDILQRVHDRYRVPLFISETSHADEKRSQWLHYITNEVIASLEAGIPIGGICIYPILGMPEWHDREQWVRFGLWDLYPNEDGNLIRHLHLPLQETLAKSQLRIEACLELVNGYA